MLLGEAPMAHPEDKVGKGKALSASHFFVGFFFFLLD